MIGTRIAGALLLAVMSVSFFGHEASAFEYQGLRVGLAFDEARAIAARMGLPLIEEKYDSRFFSVGPRPNSVATVFSCNGLLHNIALSVPGDLLTFSALSEANVDKMGKPIYNSSIMSTPGGEMYAISLKWVGRDFEEILTVSGGAGYAMSITNTYSAKSC